MGAVPTALVAALVAEGALAPLPRRVADPAGWSQGNVLLAVSARETGGLSALAARLDAIAAQGFDGLVLGPLAKSQDAPGLAVIDHEAIDPSAGSLDALSLLVTRAHERGLAVILDFVANQVSCEHAWFVAAESGDRFARDHFVWRDEGASAGAWTKSEAVGRWFYHALGPATADLDLRDKATRAWLMRAAQTWLDRGVDGLRVLGVRQLVEDGPAESVDRLGSVAVVAELGALLSARSAILIADADASAAIAARYLEGAPFVTERQRASALIQARASGRAAEVVEAVAEVERQGLSDRSLIALSTRPVIDPLAAAMLPLIAGGSLILTAAPGPATAAPGPTTAAPGPASTLSWRRASAALTLGDRQAIPLRGDPGMLALLAQDAGDRVLILANLGETTASAELDLRGLSLRSGARLVSLDGSLPALRIAGGRTRVTLEAGRYRADRIEDDARVLTVRVAIGGLSKGRPAGAIERGLRYDDRRKMGFSRDARSLLRCERGPQQRPGSCRVLLGRRTGADEALAWRVDLPPGPYTIQVRVHEPSALRGRPSLLAEGEPLVLKGSVLSRAVFVRDGQLSLEAVPEDRGGLPVAIEEISLAPAPYRALSIQSELSGDRLVIRAPGPGVVEWRMNRSSSEPVESTPLSRLDGGWSATLGPWPKGSVEEIAWVIRGADGTFITGPGGAELSRHVD
ncbi:MAG: hypothetical protein IT384_19080 [Deltaproteobacteria bacterium]|nr:hypothetical protein [Deltaproteobacteria bacterium]